MLFSPSPRNLCHPPSLPCSMMIIGVRPRQNSGDILRGKDPTEISYFRQAEVSNMLGVWRLSSRVAKALCESTMATLSAGMSKRLDLLLRLFKLLCRKKYFCAWLATCVGVLVVTKFLEMPRQSPFPSFCKPTKNIRCSSSVQGTPFFLSRTLLDVCTSPSET